VVRIALRWILIALVAASLFLAAAVALSRWRLQTETAQEAKVQSPVESIAVPLDGHGIGSQIIERAELNLRLDPYPPRAGMPATLTLVAVDRTARAVMTITPTLEVAEVTQADGRNFRAARQSNGAYVVTGRLFPKPGPWRLRLTVDFGTDEPHRMLALVEAQ
jgi:hypothetical protein